MSLFNPLSNPQFLTLIYNVLSERFELEVQHVQGHLVLVLGDAPTAAAFMKANAVKFFDFDASAMAPEPYSVFVSACAKLDFEI